MVAGQCDKYIECVNGQPSVEMLCPDGLMFYSKTSLNQTYPCQYPDEVVCKGREKLQPANVIFLCHFNMNFIFDKAAIYTKQIAN